MIVMTSVVSIFPELSIERTRSPLLSSVIFLRLKSPIVTKLFTEKHAAAAITWIIIPTTGITTQATHGSVVTEVCGAGVVAESTPTIGGSPNKNYLKSKINLTRI